MQEIGRYATDKRYDCWGLERVSLAWANMRTPDTVYTSLSYPAPLFDWLITLTLTLTSFDNIVLDQSAGSKSGV